MLSVKLVHSRSRPHRPVLPLHRVRIPPANLRGATSPLSSNRKPGTSLSDRTFVAVPPTKLSARLSTSMLVQVLNTSRRNVSPVPRLEADDPGKQLEPLITTRRVLVSRAQLRNVVVVLWPPVPIGTLQNVFVPVVMPGLLLSAVFGKVKNRILLFNVPVIALRP